LKPSDGTATRDYVFAVCYPHLVDGWKAIGKAVDNVEVGVEDFTRPAEKIVEELGTIGKDARASFDVDSGGAYVATSAAIFFTWAGAARPTADHKRAMAKKGRAALEPWLSDREKVNAAAAGMEWGSRKRFVEWYAWLREKAGE
jgi:hypothetical protein